MKKTIPLFIAVLSVAVFSCKPVKKAEKVQKQIAKNDTSKIVIVHPETQSAELDTLKQTLIALDSNNINGFGTFSGKAKANYDNGKKSYDVTASIHIKEDSAIWISVTATVFSYEAARMLVTKDSVFLLDKIHHSIIRRSIGYLQEIAKVPLSFKDFQNMLLGNPIFTKGKISSYKHVRNHWFATVKDSSISNLMTIVANDKKLFLRHSRIQDSTVNNNRVCDITYAGHQNTNNYWFPQSRNIQVSDSKATVQIKMQFKNFSFGQPVEFPFNIPSDYDEK